MILVLPSLIRLQVLDLFKTMNGRHWIKMLEDERHLCVGMRFVRSRAVNVQFSYVGHPVGILYVCVDGHSTQVVNGHLQDM